MEDQTDSRNVKSWSVGNSKQLINATLQTPTNDSTSCVARNTPSWINVLVPTFYVVIFLVGVVGNGVVIWLLIRKDRRGSRLSRRSVTNRYVLNLAFADLIFVGTLPFWIAEFFSNSWLFGTVGCKLLSFVTLINLYGSVFFLVGMGFDRFFAIVFAVRSQNHRTLHNAGIACVAIWCLATLVASQALFFRKVEPKASCPNIYQCVWNFSNNKEMPNVYFVIRIGLGFCVPLIAITCCYVCIFISLRKRNKQTANSAMRLPENKVSRLITWVIGMFVVSWLPNHIVTFLFAIKVDQQTIPYQILFPLTNTLAFANSSINPLLYAFIKDDIKTNLINLLTTKFGIKVSHTSLSNAGSPNTRLTEANALKTYRQENGLQEPLASHREPQNRNNDNDSSNSQLDDHGHQTTIQLGRKDALNSSMVVLARNVEESEAVQTYDTSVNASLI